MPHVMRRVVVLLWVGVYVTTLLWAVRVVIAPGFGYQGYVARDPTPLDLAVGSLSTAIVAMTVTPRCRRPSDVAHLFLALTTAIPVIWVPIFYGPLSSPQVQQLSASVAVAFLVIRLCLLGGRRRVTPVRVSETSFALLVAGFAVVGVLYLAGSGITPSLSGLADVYVQREVYRASVDRLGAYLVGWLAGGTFSLVIALGLFRRSVPITSAGVAGILLLYSITGYRSYIIALFLLVGTFLMTRSGSSRAWHWISALSLVIALVTAQDLARGGYGLTSLLVRRGLSTAGINTGYYVQLFDDAPKYYLGHSVLGFLGAAPYEQPPGRLVGSTYYSARTAANANFMADGFANFGWIGILAAALVVGLLLRAYDKVSHGVPLGVSAPALTLVLIALSNTAVLTVVATHGAAVLLAWTSLAPVGAALRRKAQRAEKARSHISASTA